ncbi:MAG: gluconokinase, partial [Pseudomonadota bacterium]
LEPSNRRKMAAGVALTAADRQPWMDAVCNRLRQLADIRANCVLAHSGLRRSDRRRLRNLGFRTAFLHLDADPELLAGRLAGRKGHFMPAGLLPSQFVALQPPYGEPDVFPIDVGVSRSTIIERVCSVVAAFLPKECLL